MTPSNQSRRLDIAPLRLLQDDAIAIAILIGTPACFPVRIERGDLLEPSSQHGESKAESIQDEPASEEKADRANASPGPRALAGAARAGVKLYLIIPLPRISTALSCECISPTLHRPRQDSTKKRAIWKRRDVYRMNHRLTSPAIVEYLAP